MKRPKQRYINPSPASSEFEINNWILSDMIVDKIAPAVGVHPFPLNELLLMCGAVARFRPNLIFEWGTHVGKSALVFSEASSTLGVETTIHSIDLPDEAEHSEHPYGERGRLVRKKPNVELHQGDGLDTALKILKNSGKKNRFGHGVLFFVDGDHSYESVKRELSSILKNAPNSAVLLHDTFYQSADAKYNIGPYIAVEECLKKSNLYQRIDTKTGLPGMTLIYKKLKPR